jgi:hypothetical protein
MIHSDSTGSSNTTIVANHTPPIINTEHATRNISQPIQINQTNIKVEKKEIISVFYFRVSYQVPANNSANTVPTPPVLLPLIIEYFPVHISGVLNLQSQAALELEELSSKGTHQFFALLSQLAFKSTSRSLFQSSLASAHTILPNTAFLKWLFIPVNGPSSVDSVLKQSLWF